MAKDAGGHGSESRGGRSGSAAMNDESSYRNRHTINYTKSDGTPADPAAVAAHSLGVAAVGQPAAAPNFRMNSYTHEIVDPNGNVAARMNLGKLNGMALDQGKGEGIQRSSGTALHDAVMMPDYRASLAGGGGAPGKATGNYSFPADHISGALHYLTGNDFAGHTVRRVKG